LNTKDIQQHAPPKSAATLNLSLPKVMSPSNWLKAMSPSNWSKAVSNRLFNFARAACPWNIPPISAPFAAFAPFCSISGQKFKPVQAKSAHFAPYFFYDPKSPFLWNINRAPHFTLNSGILINQSIIVSCKSLH